MSAGSLFTYVESKEALFHLVFLHGLGLLPEEPPVLPLSTPGPGRLSRCSSGPWASLRCLASGRRWPRMSPLTSHKSCAGSSRSGTT